MCRQTLLQTRVDITKSKNDVQRRRNANDKIKLHNLRVEKIAKEKNVEPKTRKLFELKPIYERINKLQNLEEKLISTFEGDYHSSILCKDVSHSKCEHPVKWHPGLKVYALCGEPECQNYYICSCGKEFGNHTTS